MKIEVEAPLRLKDKVIQGERIPLGFPGDYKPCVARLPNGNLLLVAFVAAKIGTRKDGAKKREETLLYHSRDGGQTWSAPENLATQHNLCGREPFFTILKDGTIFITVHLLAEDVRNPHGYCRSIVYRSGDGGRSWSTNPCEPPDAHPGDDCCTTRNILELRDGTLLIGTSANGGKRSFVWLSHDHGETWPERYQATIEGIGESYPHNFFGEGFWWQARSGKIYLVQRIDGHFAVKAFGDTPSHIEANSDQYDRMVLFETSDMGRSLRPVGLLGRIGEMYPSLLRLRDGRLLFTFTVRTRHPRLGVRAIIGTELNDGFEFDCEHDRIFLDTNNAPGLPSGGGFGPTVELDDGILVTSYSYFDAEKVPHMEVIRWLLPA